MKIWSILATNSEYSGALWYLKKCLTTKTKLSHASHSICVISFKIQFSFIRVRICSQSKMPAFNFTILRAGNFWHTYLKQSPVLLRALMNCFISPSFMWSGGRIFFRLISGSKRFYTRLTDDIGHPIFIFFCQLSPKVCSNVFYHKLCDPFSLLL